MNVVTGFQIPPWIVALGRGIVIAVLYAAINAVIIFFTETTDKQLLVFQPFIILFLRQLEGVMDQHFKPRSNESTLTQGKS